MIIPGEKRSMFTGKIKRPRIQFFYGARFTRSNTWHLSLWSISHVYDLKFYGCIFSILVRFDNRKNRAISDFQFYDGDMFKCYLSKWLKMFEHFLKSFWLNSKIFEVWQSSNIFRSKYSKHFQKNIWKKQLILIYNCTYLAVLFNRISVRFYTCICTVHTFT